MATLGQDADTRTLYAMYSTTAGSTTFTNNALPVNFDTKNYDNFGGITTGALAWRCYTPIAGVWQFGAAYNLKTLRDMTIYKNGTLFKYIQGAQVADVIYTTAISMYMLAGDYVDIRADTGTTTTLSTNTSFNYFTALRAPGPAQVQANENPTASYNTNAGQSIANASTVIIDFEDKIWDSFGLVTTGASWKFTSNRSGKVQVNCGIEYASALFTTGTNPKLYVYKNGAAYKQLDDILIQAAVSITNIIRLGGSALVDVLAGDTIDIRTSHGESAGRALTTTSNENYVDIAYIPGQ